jgi:hypothetical protein
MGFGLIIGFIDHTEILNKSNYSVITNSYTLQLTTALIKPSQAAVSSPVVACERLSTADVPHTLGFQTVYFRASAISFYQQRLTTTELQFFNSLTNQLTLSSLLCTALHSLTLRLAAISHQPPSLLIDFNSTTCPAKNTSARNA